MKTVFIETEMITLGQFLKLIRAIDTGGQAKRFLSEAAVRVNGEREQRRGRKLYPEDEVSIEGVGKFRLARKQGG
ncbi:ribosome maturation protein RlbA [Bacillaceae bacterium]